MVSFNLHQREQPKLSLDQLLTQSGRAGGGTPYGWHTYADRFQCWQKYYLGAKLGWERYYSPALAIGTILHEMLAIWYQTPLGEDPGDAIDSLLDVCREGGFESAVDEACRLMEAYLVRWVPPVDGKPAPTTRDRYKNFIISGPDDFLSPDNEIIAVEEMLQTDDPFNYTCRMDLAFRRPDGIWVVDHKTARALDDSVTDWALQGEILGLLWLAQKKWGDEVKGLIINLIVKSKVPAFERMSFRLRPRNIEMHLHAIQALLQFQPIAENLGWPRNFTACTTSYGKCQYFDYCKDGVTARINTGSQPARSASGLEIPPKEPFEGIEWESP